MGATIVDKDLIKRMRPEIDAALAAVGARYGVTLHAGNATFSPDGYFHFKLEGKAVGGKSKDAATYERFCGLYDLDPAGLGKAYQYARRLFTVTGMRGEKITLEAGGKEFLAKIEDFKRAASPSIVVGRKAPEVAVVGLREILGKE